MIEKFGPFTGPNVDVIQTAGVAFKPIAVASLHDLTVSVISAVKSKVTPGEAVGTAVVYESVWVIVCV